MGVRLADIIGVLDAAYPPALAESWDSVGLVCGDPDQQIDAVTVAVDATAGVVDEMDSAASGSHLLLAHHPLLLRGVDTVAASTPKGALIHRLIRSGGALFTAHTNADSASPGVSDALAEALGLTVTSVLAPQFADYDKWVVYVPSESPASVDAVRRAMFDAGAGHIGDYSDCSWGVTGAGQFRPLEGSDPTIGTHGVVEQVIEDRVEMVAPSRLRCALFAAIHAAHPYEEPAIDVLPMAPVPAGTGLGRVGVLPEPECLRDFVSRIGAALPDTVWGTRAAGDPDAPIQTVAVCGGAGDSLLSAAIGSGVDVYVTADLRHHPADEHLRASSVALVDIAHWASEFPWCAQAARVLDTEFGEKLTTRISPIRTDPWTVCVSKEGNRP
ncbi:Nif3-like dinuclear metal center hexameric protein [Mycobacterium sp. CBMA271]|uniref:Nif3-like dinuclear metal center hexameric protein n=1 Tax=unclassified Mycobacteroides TaxID=2618759 RepID=UPI0013286F96|nr:MULTISPECIES: Nif3-like dinuclear metal center hexameric protein [unclassified Mycobacteroides]MUM15988.1 Nif3-like dinuclear metal center hexameric protein [Mycobacteroides sp. CBMA 326]MUM22513.1 Nif3-like dinuclear metal center hexameric protein [Mycobacteroides sp. CBMA 271]